MQVPDTTALQARGIEKRYRHTLRTRAYPGKWSISVNGQGGDMESPQPSGGTTCHAINWTCTNKPFAITTFFLVLIAASNCLN